MCANLGCAAQVCLLTAILCGSAATVCPYPMSAAGGLLEIAMRSINYYPHVPVIGLQVVLHLVSPPKYFFCLFAPLEHLLPV